MGIAFSSPLSVAGDGGDNAREDEEGAAGTANCTVHGHHKPQEKIDLLPQEDDDGLMAPNDLELEGVRQQQESGFNSQQKRQTMPSMISSSSSNKRNRTSNDNEAPIMVTTTTTATRKMTGLDTVATIVMTHPTKNPNNFCSPQPDEKGPNNGAAAQPPVQQRRRRRRPRDRPPQQPQYNRVVSKSSSSKKKKKQRLMPGHNINAEKDPRVFAAEDEGYDKTARVLLQEQGFDPDDVLKADTHGSTPMIRFCCLGNLAMCRYLIDRGADCRKANSFGFFPLYYAAKNGHLEICELLLHHGGAHDDIRKQDRDGWSPLCAALIYKEFDVAKCLIRNGALATLGDVDGGVIDDAIMRNDLRQLHWNNDRRLPLLSWARDAVTTHDNDVKILLTGMIVSSKQTSSSLAIFNGKSGILKLIADFAVAGTPIELRTLRQLADRLPPFIADVPFVEVEMEENEVYV